MINERAKFSSQDIPAKPGVYLFRDRSGKVIYVGKAKVLRKRLSSYFQASRRKSADPKLRALIDGIYEYEFFVVKSEKEALVLESRFIKEYDPHYNIDLKDDKRFLNIAIDLTDDLPIVQLVRIQKNDGCIYFGPYPSSRTVKAVVRFFSKELSLRSCKVKNPDENSYKHCLEEDLNACSCPCVGKISISSYHQQVQRFIDILNGDIKDTLGKLDKKMRELATELKYEEAGEIRDLLFAIRQVCDPRTRNFRYHTLQSGGQNGEERMIALQEALELKEPPEVIECFDMSHLGGTFAVGSMVCFKMGKPSPKNYRRFKIKSAAPDDTARMIEVVTRRYTRLVSEGRALPNLILVDGGVAQLNATIKALQAANIPPTPVISLAKKREEVFIPGRSKSLILPRSHQGLRLVQHLRDEAHRFAISYNRKLRSDRIKNSILDEIAGVGVKRRHQLLTAFGSVKKIASSSSLQIVAAVPGIGDVLAMKILAYLNKKC